MRPRGIILALALAAVSSVALAAVLHFSWTMPTANTDGSAIPASGDGSLTETVISYGPCNATKTNLASVTGTIHVAAPATLQDSPDLPPGTWCGFAQVTNTYGVTSDPSNVAWVTKAPPKPNAPTNFTLG